MNIKEKCFELKRNVHMCARCGLSEPVPSSDNPNKYMPTRLKVPPEYTKEKGGILIVGEAPGADEIRQGRPFIGVSGDLLRMFISKYRMENEIVLSNIVLCRPPGNRTPKSDEIKACNPFLKDVMKIFEPRVILAIGKVAANTILGFNSKISTLVGNIYEIKEGVYVTSSFHPAAAIRSGRAFNSYLYHSINVSFALTRYIYDHTEKLDGEKIRLDGIELNVDTDNTMEAIF